MQQAAVHRQHIDMLRKVVATHPCPGQRPHRFRRTTPLHPCPSLLRDSKRRDRSPVPLGIRTFSAYRRRRDGCVEGLRRLDRKRPDAARPPLHEEPVSCMDSRRVEEVRPYCERSLWQRCCGRKFHILGTGRQHPLCATQYLAFPPPGTKAHTLSPIFQRSPAPAPCATISPATSSPRISEAPTGGG